MKSYPAHLVEAVDQLLYKIRHKNVWEICDFAIKVWERKNPVEARRFLKAQKEYKESRKNKFASTDSKWLRHNVNIPSDISYILEKFAKHKIDDYGRQKFWRDFARRYPGFSSAEKI